MANKTLKRWTKKPTPTAKVEGDFSFYFDIVNQYWAGGANEQRAAPLNRICTLARKMGVAAVLVEDALDRKEVQREIEVLRKSSSTGGTVTAAAISFLRALPSPEQEGPPDEVNMIGQVVVLTYPAPNGPKSYVFDAIMRVPARWEDGHEVSLVNRCVPKAQTFQRTAGGCRYQVAGAYYCQENGVSRGNVQAALRIAIRSIEGSSSVADDKLSKAARPKGIVDVIVKTLKNRGYGYNLYEIDKNVDDVWTAICSFIESGNPPLLVVSGRGNQDRIIPILGYTINTDEWHPGGSMPQSKDQAGFFSSSQWIDHVIVHDTELGPYFCMSRAWLAQELGRASKSRMKPRLVIAPIWTKQVNVSPVYAEQLAGQYLGFWVRRITQANAGTGRWWDYLSQNGSHVVLRTTFISSQDYQSHLQKLDDKIQLPAPAPTWITPGEGKPNSFDSFMRSLPDNFWICEISLPQLYGGNRKKLGEVLIDPRNKNLAEAILAIRLPSRAVWRSDQGYLLAPTGMDAHGELLEASALTVS
ncbi:hypothetical protein ACVMFA_007310 [Bradyrhizobium liaoningense]|uniref:hypothetical protein n=1 Tax=Bradyrhizobium liaoningense TaxID=43992 RepID=UPI00235B7250|nr:hypothetical protein [Bradyrhizobium liaoningense]GLR94007.1 hypothetical protein GCM10007858_16350 [Bradyrhizobium liaoningense]